MRVSVKILSFFGTLLVLAAGFILPDATSVYQDLQAQTKTDRYDLTTVQINTIAETDIFEVMKLVESDSYTSINLSEGGRLNTEEAFASTQEFLTLFQESGVNEFAENNYENHKITPFLAMGDSRDEAVILWNCEFILEEKGYETLSMIVDDASGKVVSFRYSNSETSVEEIDAGALIKNVSLSAEVCSRYYELDAVETEEDTTTVNEVSDYWEAIRDLSKGANPVVRVTHAVYSQNFSSDISDADVDTVESNAILESSVSIVGIETPIK